MSYITVEDNGVRFKVDTSKTESSAEYGSEFTVDLKDHQVNDEIIAEVVDEKTGEKSTVYFRAFTGWDNAGKSSDVAVDGDINVAIKQRANSVSVDEGLSE